MQSSHHAVPAERVGTRAPCGPARLAVRKAVLSPARRSLLELMQRQNFGRFEGLAVRNGDPVLDPPPRIVREYKFAAENGPRPELGVADFLLKVQVLDLFSFLDQFRDGTIDVLEFKHGLPFRMLVARSGD